MAPRCRDTREKQEPGTAECAGHPLRRSGRGSSHCARLPETRRGGRGEGRGDLPRGCGQSLRPHPRG